MDYLEIMQKIMFNDKYGLTEAVLKGRKTQTRRIVPDGTPLGNWSDTEAHARYKIDEVVAVAQKYKDIAEYLPQDPIGLDTTSGTDIFSYNHFDRSEGWHNKMFVRADQMPHHIRITNIRVERLKDISDEDCMAEGIFECVLDNENGTCVNMFSFDNKLHYFTPLNAYAALMEKVSGKGTWDSNPWVFVYEFELAD